MYTGNLVIMISEAGSCLYDLLNYLAVNYC